MFGFQEIITRAPPSSPFLLNDSLAFRLSSKVFPRKVPRPRPEFKLNSFDFDLIYGSPIILIMSSGIPGPSSLILISINSSSLFKFIFTLLLENFTALPIKFLKP